MSIEIQNVRHDYLGIETTPAKYSRRIEYHRALCACGWRSFDSTNDEALKRAWESHASRFPGPFCITAFMGNLYDEYRSHETEMLGLSAAIRFELIPCRCEGCQAYAKRLTQLGGGQTWRTG